MPAIRLQASVQSGKTILHLRNALEDPVTVTPFLATKAEGESAWSPVVPSPVKLKGGQIHTIDVTASILKLFTFKVGAKLQKKLIRVRLVVGSKETAEPREVDGWVAFQHNRFIEFNCH